VSYGDPAWQQWVSDEAESLKLLKHAWDVGITSVRFFSLSLKTILMSVAVGHSQCQSSSYPGYLLETHIDQVYSNGESERIIGKALKEFKIPRNKVQILTKCFGIVGEGKEWVGAADVSRNKNYINQHGLSRAAIFNAVEASLERLDTPYIDLYQIHRADQQVPKEETMKALHDRAFIASS
jgi:diketogulonate reductase-like aldo/keto reductase